MKKNILVIAAVIGCFPASVAFAADSNNSQTLCHAYGHTFSQNLTIRNGDEHLQCEPGGGWETVHEEKNQNTNCFFNDGVYSEGARVDFGSGTIRCNANGKWDLK